MNAYLLEYLPATLVLTILLFLHLESSSSESSSSEEDEIEEEGLEEDEDIVTVINTTTNTSIGQWEEHTNVRMRNTASMSACSVSTIRG